jgi:hypothetical protein
MLYVRVMTVNRFAVQEILIVHITMSARGNSVLQCVAREPTNVKTMSIVKDHYVILLIENAKEICVLLFVAKG